MNPNDYANIIELALAEDLGSGDLTASLLPCSTQAHAYIISQQEAILCGTSFVTAIFAKIDPTIKVEWLATDGSKINPKQQLAHLYGPTRALLSGERTALNFLQTLSSTATLTHQLVTKLKDSNTKLLDTRKTLPGLRLAQKYAVRCGGGTNHRYGLYDAILIKENHISAAGSITKVVAHAKKLYPSKKIEIEVKNLPELEEALSTAATIIMLDNFTLPMVRAAVRLTQNSAKLEVSGGINVNNIAAYAQTGVDYISVGTITKTVIPIELSLLFTTP